MPELITDQFRDVVGYQGKYFVTTCGNVYNADTERFLTLRITEQGYQRVDLTDKDGVRKTHRVHRLVAEAFLENPDNLPYVNHISADRADNRLENLEWISPKDNLAHAVKLGNRDAPRDKNLHPEIVAEIKSRHVQGCKDHGKLAIARDYNISPQRVRKIVNGFTFKDKN